MIDPASGVTLSFIEGDGTTLRLLDIGTAKGTEIPKITSDMTTYAYTAGLLLERTSQNLPAIAIRNAAAQVAANLQPWFIDEQQFRSDVRKKIGKFITRKRTEKGLSTRQLAALADLSHNTVYNIEAGKFSAGADILTKIARVLDTQIIIE